MKVTAKLTKFRCFWCRVRLPASSLHHKVTGSRGRTRRCCHRCHTDLDSPYRRIYPGGAKEEHEEIERIVNRELDKDVTGRANAYVEDD